MNVAAAKQIADIALSGHPMPPRIKGNAAHYDSMFGHVREKHYGLYWAYAHTYEIINTSRILMSDFPLDQ